MIAGFPYPQARTRNRKQVEKRLDMSLLGTIGKIAAGVLLGIALTLGVLVFLAPGPQPAQTATATTPDISVTVSDAYLTRAAGAAISQAQLPVTIGHVRASIAPGDQLTLSGNAEAVFGLVQRPLAATSQLEATNGHLAIHITNATLGGMPLPSPVTAVLENSVNTQLTNAMTGLVPGNQHYVVTGVTTGSHLVTIQMNQQR